MKTNTTPRLTRHDRNRWPEPLGPASAPEPLRPFALPPCAEARHDFLIMNPHPEFTEPPPPPPDLIFYSIDYP